MFKNSIFSSLASSYVELLHPHYDELCRIVSSIDGVIHNPSAIGIFVAHIAFTKIKISNHPQTNQIAELFLNKWMRFIISVVPSTDKSTTRKQLIADLNRTMPVYTTRIANTLKSDITEEDRYNEMLYLTVDLHIETLGNNHPTNYSNVTFAAQVVHRIALDILDDVQVTIENNQRSSLDNLRKKLKRLFIKDKDGELNAEKRTTDHKSNVINTSSELNPIKLFRPSNFDTAADKSLAVFKGSGKFPYMNEMPNETFTGMFSEMIKMLWLETKLGKENIDFTLGNREYFKDTSIQKQIVLLKNGTTENYYFDFSSFGEKF